MSTCENDLDLLSTEGARIGAQLQAAAGGLRQVAVDRWLQIARLRREYLGDEAGALAAEQQAARIASETAQP